MQYLRPRPPPPPPTPPAPSPPRGPEGATAPTRAPAPPPPQRGRLIDIDALTRGGRHGTDPADPRAASAWPPSGIANRCGRSLRLDRGPVQAEQALQRRAAGTHVIAPATLQTNTNEKDLVKEVRADNRAAGEAPTWCSTRRRPDLRPKLVQATARLRDLTSSTAEVARRRRPLASARHAGPRSGRPRNSRNPTPMREHHESTRGAWRGPKKSLNDGCHGSFQALIARTFLAGSIVEAAPATWSRTSRSARSSVTALYRSGLPMRARWAGRKYSPLKT